jgi:hypothetical protein
MYSAPVGAIAVPANATRATLTVNATLALADVTVKPLEVPVRILPASQPPTGSLSENQTRP